jgi:hypothetical protein
MAPIVITAILPPLASPGKAVNGRGTVHPHEDPIQEVQAKCQKSSTSVDESLSRFWPPNLLDIIKSIVKLESSCPVKPLFIFNLNSKAAGKNCLILKKFDLDIGRSLEAQSLLPLGYGSEFRKGNTLFPLLRYHPIWPCMEQLLLEGLKRPTSPIPEECRITDLNEAINFGNHKGATSQPELLQELVTGYMIHSYAIPLPLNKIKNNPSVCMAPLNIQAQWRINKRGKITKKDRLTHDQSFEWASSGTSVNSRIDTTFSNNANLGNV